MTVKQKVGETTVADCVVLTQIMEIGKKHFRGRFRLIGELPPITEPVYVNGFRYDLLENLELPIPSEAMEPVDYIQSQPLPVVQWLGGDEFEADEVGLPIIAHPLARPERAKISVRQKVDEIGQKASDMAEFIVPVLSVLAVAIGAVAYVTVMLIASMAMIDPNIVAVIEDNSTGESRHFWVEVSWWIE